MSNLEAEGSVGFWLTRPGDPMWADRAADIAFGDFTLPPLRISANKIGSRLVISVSGIFGQTFEFSEPIPKLSKVPKSQDLGVSVGVTWKFPEVKLYLQGKPTFRQEQKAH